MDFYRCSKSIYPLSTVFEIKVKNKSCFSHRQVEATTEKRAVVLKRTRLFFRDTQCTGITARPG